ncbi:MAG: ATP-binding protein [Flavobacteriales bacterium]
MKQYGQILVVLLTFLSYSSESKSQSNYTIEQQKQLNNLLENYPYPTEGNDHFILYQELFKNYFFPNVPARDSLWKLIENKSIGISTLDSATYEAFIGLEFYFNKEYDKAVPYLSEAIFKFKNEKFWSGYLEVKRQLHNITYFQKAVQKAYNGYKEIYEHPQASNYMKSRVVHNMGALLMELEHDIYRGKPSQQKDSITEIITDYLKEAIRLVDDKDSYSVASTYSILVDVYLENSQLDSALYYTNESTKLAKAINDDVGLAFINIKKSALLDSLGQYNEALKCLDEAIAFYESTDEYDQRIHAFTRKAETLLHMGKVLEAYELSRTNNALVSEKLSTELSKSLAKYETQYETASKELIIKEQEITISNRTRWALMLALGIVLTLLVFTYFFQRNKRLTAQEKDALIIQSKQENLNAVINAQEEERKRIAKDLHDGIVQQLGGLKLGFQKVLKNDLSPDSERLLKILDESADELRELSHQMMPKSLSDLGLVPAMKDMLDNSLGHSEINYNFEHFGLGQRIAERKEIALYRIAQELVNNVIKHSGASEVNIQLFRNVKHIMLIVEDNGTGINEEASKKGIGLMNISSRLDSIKGNVNYEPSPNSGTLVTIKIPLS